jgi:hypothetical protein
MAWEEGAELPADLRHPLNLLFPQEVAMMRGMVEGKSDRAYKRQKELKNKPQAAANVATTA